MTKPLYEEDKEMYLEGYTQAKLDILGIMQEPYILEAFNRVEDYNKVYKRFMQMEANDD